MNILEIILKITFEILYGLWWNIYQKIQELAPKINTTYVMHINLTK
jgi:hypothetical protein